MILSGLSILSAINNSDIYIEDFHESRLGPNSYNLRLHNELMVYVDETFDRAFQKSFWKKAECLDMKKNNRVHKIDIPEEGLVLQPGILYLGRTVEYTSTDKYVPLVEGRSSVGRLGLFVHITAGFGDIGYEGCWTLEMSCIQPVKIYPNVEICQIYFHKIEGDYVKYNKKYAFSKDIIPSKMYLDFEKNNGE